MRKLVNIRNVVMVEVENEEGEENLMKQEALREAGMKVERPSKKRPIIMAYDVNASLNSGEVQQEICFVRNTHDSEIHNEEFRKEFEVQLSDISTRTSSWEARKCMWWLSVWFGLEIC